MKGIQTNLFKCFVPISWYINRIKGVASYIHDRGIFDDSNGGLFRSYCYNKLKYLFRFQNEKKLFSSVGNEKKYELSVFGPTTDEICFNVIANVYHPLTIDQSYKHEGSGLIPGIKNENNQWNTAGHRDRILTIDKSILGLFSKLYDTPGTPASQARLPFIHANQTVIALEKLSEYKVRLGSAIHNFFSTVMWDETSRQEDGTIKRNTSFPVDLDHWVVSGPHFYVSTPFFQTPRAICETHRAYDNLDLSKIPSSYLPRTNYLPSLELSEYHKQLPQISWESGLAANSLYRMIHRRRLNISQERTFISAILPPGACHIHTVISTSFKTESLLLDALLTTSSIVFDYWVKSSGRGDFTAGEVKQIPIIEKDWIVDLGRIRVMMLNCLTSHYSDLWSRNWKKSYCDDNWTKVDDKLDNSKFKSQRPLWDRSNILVTDFERRNALVEIDVLVAIGLGLNLRELQAIYRIQFPVLKQNEYDTWYDKNGRIVFTVSKGLPGVGLSRKEWESIKGMQTGAVERKIIDDTMPGGPVERTIVYEAPFDRCDRERDYEVAWTEFEKRFGKVHVKKSQRL